MNPRLYWIPGPWKGRLAITSRPRGNDWLGDEVQGWRTQGVDVVVSLLEPHEVTDLGLEQESTIAAQHRIRAITFPIEDRNVPTSLSEAESLLRELQHELDAGRTVAIHCRQSVGRSSLIAAGLLIAAGEDSDKALEAISAARKVAVPETNDQLSWIRRLPNLFAVR